MNYRHIYHAGNFADVFKHILLISLIQSLQRKPKPFCYVDTHAGIGCYDLTVPEALKTGEFQQGIAKLWTLTQVPEIVATYLALVRQYNRHSQLRFYPGSPVLVKMLLREQDRMLLCELHPEDVQQLQQVFWQEKQVIIQPQNGYQILKAFLPPAERRGLVLIDPPFENLSEFDDAVKALTTAYQRWQTGIYALWYPIKVRDAVVKFHRHLSHTGIAKLLIAELCIYPDDIPLGLNGAGLVIVNPPWQFEEQLQMLLPWLWRELAVKQKGGYEIKWIINE
jgi:23S rRNA (adenine2030-N6)-methyltransferase